MRMEATEPDIIAVNDGDCGVMVNEIELFWLVAMTGLMVIVVKGIISGCTCVTRREATPAAVLAWAFVTGRRGCRVQSSYPRPAALLEVVYSLYRGVE